MVHFARIKNRIVEAATTAAIRAMEERTHLPTAMAVAEAIAAATAAAAHEVRDAGNKSIGQNVFWYLQ